MYDAYRYLYDKDSYSFWSGMGGYDDDSWDEVEDQTFYDENYLKSGASASYPEEAYDWTWTDRGTYDYPTTIDAGGTEYITGQSDLSVQARDHDAYQGMQGLEPGSPEEEASFLKYHPEAPWTQQLSEGISDLAYDARKALSKLSGIPMGDVAKIAGYLSPRGGGGKQEQQFRSAKARPVQSGLPGGGGARLRPPGEAASMSEVVRSIIQGKEKAERAAQGGADATREGNAYVENNQAAMLSDIQEHVSGRKTLGPNIKEMPIRLSRRQPITLDT